MTADLRERLDASFGDGPAHRPVIDRLTAGRRARRRRRLVVLIGSAASLAAGAAVAFATIYPQTSAGGGIGPDPVPPPPSASATPIPVRLLVAPPRYVGAGAGPVLYLFGRMFKSSRDVTVLTTYGLIDTSTHPRGAAIVRVGGHTTWVAIAGNQPHAVLTERDGPYDLTAFRGWAQAEIAVLSGRQALAATSPGGYRAPLADQDAPAAYSGDLLVAKPGGTVVRRIRQPLVNEAAVRPCNDQAVQVHTPAGDWFVLGYDCPDGGALYTEPVGLRATSLASWLVRVHHAQDRFEY